ncbi:MAG: PQQ-dependent sugar dehydrogenase, partial [Segetibacter sp.]
ERFIKNPQKIISSGDKRAQQLFKKYKVVMPSFPSFKDDGLKNIVAFLNIQKLPPRQVADGSGMEIKNPVPEPIKASNLVVGLEKISVLPPSGISGQMPLTRITKLDYQQKNGNLFVLDMRGKLYQLNHNKPLLYMDIEKLQPKLVIKPGLGTGFGSFAFHPEFSKNGLLYTTHTEPARSAIADFAYHDSIRVTVQWVISEWKADNPADTSFSGKRRELFRVNVVNVNHGVQEITFNPLSKPGNEDYGLLYIAIGDGGAVENGFPFLAHNLENIWGTIFRIDPRGNNSANKQYGIPKNNPFAKNTNSKILKEIYAYGFRNPHRITWSSKGKMIVSNIGHGNAETVNLVEPGNDFGWPIREGTFSVNPYGNLNKVYPLPSNDKVYNITYPIAQFDHDEGKANAGGFEYTGTALPQLKSKFLFGDIPSGRLFYFDMADVKQGKQALVKEWKITINGTATTLKEACGSDRVDLHFGKDSKGELYVLTKADGKVYKIVSSTKELSKVVK